MFAYSLSIHGVGLDHQASASPWSPSCPRCAGSRVSAPRRCPPRRAVRASASRRWHPARLVSRSALISRLTFIGLTRLDSKVAFKPR
jgi:hypothetical protein